jgi:hypothetical protein
MVAVLALALIFPPVVSPTAWAQPAPADQTSGPSDVQLAAEAAVRAAAEAPTPPMPGDSPLTTTATDAAGSTLVRSTGGGGMCLFGVCGDLGQWLQEQVQAILATIVRDGLTRPVGDFVGGILTSVNFVRRSPGPSVHHARNRSRLRAYASTVLRRRENLRSRITIARVARTALTRGYRSQRIASRWPSTELRSTCQAATASPGHCRTYVLAASSETIRANTIDSGDMALNGAGAPRIPKRVRNRLQVVGHTRCQRCKRLQVTALPRQTTIVTPSRPDHAVRRGSVGPTCSRPRETRPLQEHARDRRVPPLSTDPAHGGAARARAE